MRVRRHIDGINKRFVCILAAAVAVGGMAGYILHGGPGRPEVAHAQGRGVAEPMVIYMSQLDGNRAAICLVDGGRNRLAVYQVDFTRQRLKLLAVRDFSADLGLDDYNNAAPLPKDIRAWLEGKKGD